MTSPSSDNNKNKDDDSTEQSKNGFFDFLYCGETKFIIIFIAAIVVIKVFFIDEFNSFLTYFKGFNMMNQFLIPSLFGALGGYCYIIIDGVKGGYRQDIKHIKKKFSFVGSVAGITAVNLLNPSGTVSQVMILGLIAGLSGFSYLKRNALVDSHREDSIMEDLKSDSKVLSTEEVDSLSSKGESPNEKAEVIYSNMLEMMKRYEDKNKS
ncbi:hypothetical protein FJQ98_16735 [Lysinibacillus agricola]|uniref:Uncharacterized protein n=1 Tax=Lysinibacillus agricola TaxID=2590012 RepID=A0ABX7ANM4_9BACI|nr:MULTISPECIES: hypothetical protein [Lysinibacillus]KOS61428.1 hypothetical protein AN161_17695 [Lysinibacillus sp. FJAT-14222]QQP10892.1 hypothetical protein FJQ98_16735 [Lysinibacillus agricola]